MKTTGQLAKAAGVGRQTIIRWHRAEVIPAPAYAPSENGRGRRAVWDDWVELACARIPLLLRQGHSLDEVKRLMRPDTGSAYDDVLSRCQAAASELEKLEVESGVSGMQLLIAMMASRMRECGIDPARIDTSLRALEVNTWLTPLLMSLCAGEQPLLIVNRKAVTFAPDYLLPRLFAATWTADGTLKAPAGEAAVVIPIRRDFISVLSDLIRRHAPLRAIGLPLQSVPRKSAAPTVWSRHGDYIVEDLFTDVSPWGAERFGANTKTVRWKTGSERIVGHVKPTGEQGTNNP